jgi:hypothetical protein
MVVTKGLAGSLVINAIAAGLAGISAIFALLAYFCSSRAMEVVSYACRYLCEEMLTESLHLLHSSSQPLWPGWSGSSTSLLS